MDRAVWESVSEVVFYIGKKIRRHFIIVDDTPTENKNNLIDLISSLIIYILQQRK